MTKTRNTLQTHGLLKRCAPLLACTLAALGFFVLVALTLGVRYTVNDDAIISNIASGAFGGARWRLVYVNILFGFVLRPFYWLAPTLNWFVILQVGIGLVCFGLFGALLCGRLGNVRGGIAYALLLCLAGTDLFASFHYVRYGGLYLTAGFALLFLELGHLNRRSVCGMALVFLGSLMRFDNLLAIAALAAAGLIWRFIGLEARARRRTLVMGLALLAAIGLVAGADALSYRLDGEWAAYTRFNAARTEISDYRLQYVGEDADPAAFGLSDNELLTLEHWAFYDGEVFPVERVEHIAQALPTNTLRGTLGNALRSVKDLLFDARGEHLLLLAVLGAWLLLSGKRNWPAVLGALAVYAAELLYLSWRGRYPERIDAGLVLALAVFLALQLDIRPEKNLSARWLALAGTLVLLATAPGLSQRYAATRDYWASRPAHAAQFDTLSADKDTLYLVGTVHVDAAVGYDVWHAREEGYFSNIVFVGSWLMHSPFEQDTLAAYGLENPYRDAVDNPHVLFADFYHREAKEHYLREHYGDGIRLVPVRELLEMNLYEAKSAQE